jgi:hypothetical protein
VHKQQQPQDHPDARHAPNVGLDEVVYSLPDPERLFNEANLLRLEGRIFCFDPKEAGRRAGSTQTFEETVKIEDIVKQPIIIKPDPAFGYPSPLAYKVLQAISKKLTEEGFPVPTSVSFSQRELARLIGRSSFGGADSKELYRAVMQLHTTRVQCSFYDKKTDAWATASFYILYEALFSGRKASISACMVSVHPRIVESLNNKHYACLNWNRLLTLEPIGMAFYKRLFYHFSNLYHPRRAREKLRFEKDYEDICGEWLGGLKPEKYRSKILQTQLGRHFAALRDTKLVRKIDIEKRADGSGLKLVALPGPGFFEDYEDFYVRQTHPQLRFKQTAALREIQQPMELVARFHKLMGHELRTFDDREITFASSLLERYGIEDACDLVEYAVRTAEQTKFKMQLVMAVKGYIPRWEVDKEHRSQERKRRQAIAGCPFCNDMGYLTFEETDGRILMHPCPHEAAMIVTIEERKGLRRLA